MTIEVTGHSGIAIKGVTTPNRLQQNGLNSIMYDDTLHGLSRLSKKS